MEHAESRDQRSGYAKLDTDVERTYCVNAIYVTRCVVSRSGALHYVMLVNEISEPAFTNRLNVYFSSIRSLALAARLHRTITART